MTIIVSVKINDGIVMASDSALSFATGQIYHHGDKIVNLCKGLPLGVMVTGEGGIGSESITTLLKDLRLRLSGRDPANPDWGLDPEKYTVGEVAERLREFMFAEKALNGPSVGFMRFRICGYSYGRPLPEIWEVKIMGKSCDNPTLVRKEADFGVNWDGEYDVLNRLILGIPVDFNKVAVESQLYGTDAEAEAARQKLVPGLYQSFVMTAMPIQDAIDLARFLVETTIGAIHFNFSARKTVGGPIEIATITKHEGFRWIARKHFYRAELNPADTRGLVQRNDQQ